MTTIEKFKKLIIITGPTCSGKTNISFNIANKFNKEIICADSLQVYKDFDIGTGKPTKKQQKIINHHLIDIVKPFSDYNAWNYMLDARRIVSESNQNTFIISGGSQLYIDAFLNGLTAGINKDDKIRNELIEKIKLKGLDTLYKTLAKIDPRSSNKVSSNDTNRIIRLLEIFYVTGEKPSEFLSKSPKEKISNTKYLKISLNISKTELDILIEKRVHQMIENGLIDEVANIISKYGNKIKPLYSIGYKELFHYLNQDSSLNDSINKIIVNTRRLAKRQLTWLRKDSEIRWCKDINEMEDLIKDFI